MCGNCNDPFHGLDDDLNDLFGGPVNADDGAAGKSLAQAEADRIASQSFSEPCRACRGTGRFVSYSGRTVGPCYKCKGTGKLVFKTSPDVRAKAAAKRAADADQKRIDLQAARKRWIEANPADFEWMRTKSESDRPFEFAVSIMEAFFKYGSLTERQHAAVTRLRLADEERKAARKVEAERRAANAPVVNLDKIEEAFSAAQANGIKRPKLRLDTFKFSLAPAHGMNAGAIYAVDADSDQYLGKIKDGRFMRVRECSDDQEARIIAVCANPKAAAIAYGKRTGKCCICGRELTNHESIDLGIGPICAGRMGW